MTGGSSETEYKLHVPSCGICLKEIEINLHSCPACSSTYHRNHLSMWLTIKNTCPNCRFEIPFVSLLPEIAAESKKKYDRRRRLYRLANTGEIIDDETIIRGNLYEKPKRTLTYEEHQRQRPIDIEPSSTGISLILSSLSTDIRSWWSKPRREKGYGIRKFFFPFGSWGAIVVLIILLQIFYSL